MRIEQLRSSSGDEHGRCVTYVLRQIIEERDFGAVGPVHVLEQEDRRLRMRDALDEATRRIEEDASVGDFVVRRNTQQQEQMPSCRSPLVERDQLANRRLE